MRRLAKTLRKNATEHERWMWIELRGLKVYGARFRRQVRLGNYIVDFACHRSKIVIELDGLQHGEDGHEHRDKIRDTWLETEGYHVIRFWNSEMHEDIYAVMDAIYEKVKSRLPSP